MQAPEIDEFAKLIIKHIRDRAIASCDMSRDPDCNSLEAKRWRQIIKTSDPNQILTEIIPDCVDSALFCFLHAIDDGLIELFFRSSSGKLINLMETGESEMAGRCAMGGPDDWRTKFSQERINDDLANLE